MQYAIGVRRCGDEAKSQVTTETDKRFSLVRCMGDRNCTKLSKISVTPVCVCARHGPAQHIVPVDLFLVRLLLLLFPQYFRCCWPSIGVARSALCTFSATRLDTIIHCIRHPPPATPVEIPLCTSVCESDQKRRAKRWGKKE